MSYSVLLRLTPGSNPTGSTAALERYGRAKLGQENAGRAFVKKHVRHMPPVAALCGVFLIVFNII